MSFLQEIDKRRVPTHIAVIMDGNGRWAQEKNLPRTQGHIAGVEAVRKTVKAARRIGVRYLTLYAFSTENWNRPQEEVDALMGLLVQCLQNELPLFMENGVRLRVIGQTDRFSDEIREALQQTLDKTEVNTGMDLVLALSYSSRWELVEASRKIAREAAQGKLDPANIDADCISQHLSTCFMPDPDLLIRTSGEERISNFLLWQIAYSELYFTQKYWPDFDDEALYEAICKYQKRERRFGLVSSQLIESEKSVR